MNPLQQMLSSNNSNMNPMSLLSMLSQGQSPQALFGMMKNSPQFRQFYELNKNKTLEQLINGQ